MPTPSLKLTLNIKDFGRIQDLAPERVIKYLQMHQISPAAITDSQIKYSVLHIAILNKVDAYDLVKKLFEQESALKNTLNTPLTNDETLLIFAARHINNNNLDIMKFLVENGADPEVRTQDNKTIPALLNTDLSQQWQEFLQDYEANKQLKVEKKSTKKTLSSESVFDFFSYFFKQTNSSSTAEQKTPLLSGQKLKKD